VKSPHRELSLQWNFCSVENLLQWNFHSSGANVPRTFVPMKLSFHENEYSKNFRSKCPKTQRETGCKPYNSLRALITCRKNFLATDLSAVQCWLKGVISTGNYRSTKCSNVPQNESSKGAKVLSMDFCLRKRKCRGTKRPDTVDTPLIVLLLLLLLLLNSYTKYNIRTNKKSKSKRNTLGYSGQTDLMTVSISSLVNMHCCLSFLSITITFITPTSACKLVDTFDR